MEIMGNEVLIRYDSESKKLIVFDILRDPPNVDRYGLHTQISLDDLKGKGIVEIEQIIGRVISIATGISEDL